MERERVASEVDGRRDWFSKDESEFTESLDVGAMVNDILIGIYNTGTVRLGTNIATILKYNTLSDLTN